MSDVLRHAAHDAGFTLIELVVGMILLMALLVPVIGSLTNLTGIAGNTHATNRAQQSSRQTASMIASDIKAARAPLRATGQDVDQGNSLAEDLELDRIAQHDIYFASPTAIVFFADVLNLATAYPATAANDVAYGPEFVSYFVDCDTCIAPEIPNGLVSGASPARAPGSICETGRWCIVRQLRWGSTDLRLGAMSGSSFATLPSVTYANVTTEVLMRGVGPFPGSHSCYTPSGPVSYTADAGAGGNLSVAFPGDDPASTLGGPRMFCYRWARPGSNSYTRTGWRRACFSLWSDAPGAAWNTSPAGVFYNDGAMVGPVWRSDPYLTQDSGGSATRLSGDAFHRSDQLVEVGIVVPAVSQRGATLTRAASVHDSAPLRNRSGAAYRRGIACGER